MNTNDALKVLAQNARDRAYYFERRAGKVEPGAREPRSAIMTARREMERWQAEQNAAAFKKAAEMIMDLTALAR